MLSSGSPDPVVPGSCHKVSKITHEAQLGASSEVPDPGPILAPVTPDLPPSFPLADFLGLALETTPDGEARGRIQVGPHHLNPNGFVHGAVLFALVDTVMGHATVAALPPGEGCTTVDLHIRFHRPVTAGPVEATARIVHRGRRLLTLTGEIRDGEGRLLASATAGFFTIDLPEAE